VGLWSLLTAWRGKKHPSRALRRRGGRSTRQTAAARQCRFETMEERRLLDADPIKIGVTYLEADSGSDKHGDTFQVLFEGGAAGTELTQLVIDGEHTPGGLSVGDMIFDTIKGGLGADEAFPLQVISSTGIDQVSWQVSDGGTSLVFEFHGFQAGEKLIFSVDVDEVQQFDPNETNLQLINEGIDPIASGVEFQGSHLTADFQAPHYFDASGTGEFRNHYDPLFAGSQLLVSQGNQNGLPNDDFEGQRDRSTGTMLTVQQRPQPITIGGRVFADNNRNLVQDGSDFGLPSVTLALWKQVNGQWTFTGHTTTTDGQGDYEFGLELDLQTGVYEVRETQPAGYFSVGSIPGNVSGTPSGSSVPGDPDVLTQINIPFGGQNAVHYDFAEAQPASIRGHVELTRGANDCEDENAQNEPLPGVKISIKDVDGDVVATTFTDENGDYEFNDLLPGIYTIVEETPPGLIDGDEHIGTINGIHVGTIATDDVVTNIVLDGGQHGIDYDFCELLPVSIAGHVFADTIPNCMFDPGELPISGVTIELLNEQGIVIATTLTDAQGAYKFENFPAGIYTVHELQPAGYFQGGQTAGSLGGDDTQDDLIATVTLVSGDHGINYDFCERPPGKISGYVFRDGAPILTEDGSPPANLYQLRDGQLTSDDLRLGGVVLELRHTLTGDPVLGDELLPGTHAPGVVRTVTDANGYYEFTGLPEGNYSIFEVQPNGYFDSLDTPGTTNGVAVNVGTFVSPLVVQRFAALGVVFHNDAILQVPLAIGQVSQLNNFSEIQTFKIIIPPPPPETPKPPENPPQPLLVFPPIVLPPQVFIPQPPAPAPVIGGGGAFTWHLSVIDAGLPRVARRSTRQSGIVFKPALWVEKTEWQHDKMQHGAWLIHGAQGAGPQMLFGLPDAIPVVGDFNGDGKDEIGIYYKGEWFLDLNGNGQWDPEDLWAKLGSEQDRPVTGDWDGDGKDDIGIFGPEWPGDPVHLEHEPGLPDQDNQRIVALKPKNVPPTPEQATDGERLMRLTAHGKERADLIDHVFQFGGGQDIPIAGDWNGDGIRSVGVFRNGKWHFDVDGDGRWSEGDKVANFGQKGDKPVVGDFDGDGIEEIAIFRGGKFIIDTNGNREIDDGDRVVELGQEGDLPIAGDFDGDGIDEPAVYRPVKE
jgi:hypothetical protein